MTRGPGAEKLRKAGSRAAPDSSIWSGPREICGGPEGDNNEPRSPELERHPSSPREPTNGRGGRERAA